MVHTYVYMCIHTHICKDIYTHIYHFLMLSFVSELQVQSSSLNVSIFKYEYTHTHILKTLTFNMDVFCTNSKGHFRPRSQIKGMGKGNGVVLLGIRF